VPAPPARGPSRRMVLWLVVAPAALLALAFAGANWRVFHLAWCKHLMKSDYPAKQLEGLRMVLDMHLRKGMTAEEVRGRVAPLEMKREADEDYVEQARVVAEMLRISEETIKRSVASIRARASRPLAVYTVSIGPLAARTLHFRLSFEDGRYESFIDGPIVLHKPLLIKEPVDQCPKATQ